MEADADFALLALAFVVFALLVFALLFAFALADFDELAFADLEEPQALVFLLFAIAFLTPYYITDFVGAAFGFAVTYPQL